MPHALVSGLCSVGKSSFVAALWGDAELLPTAVRDCTQTNTLIRAPRANESERQILLQYLSREQALNFAARVTDVRFMHMTLFFCMKWPTLLFYGVIFINMNGIVIAVVAVMFE